MTPLCNQNNHPGTNPKDMEICVSLDKEFKIAVLRDPNGIQENTEKQFGEIKKINLKTENFFKKREREKTLKENKQKFWS